MSGRINDLLDVEVVQNSWEILMKEFISIEDKMYVRPKIPDKIITNAKKKFVDSIDGEVIIAIFVTTKLPFIKGSRGVAITNRGIYWRIGEDLESHEVYYKDVDLRYVRIHKKVDLGIFDDFSIITSKEVPEAMEDRLQVPCYLMKYSQNDEVFHQNLLVFIKNTALLAQRGSKS